MTDKTTQPNITIQEVRAISDKVLELIKKESRTTNPAIIDEVLQCTRWDLANSHYFSFNLSTLLNHYNLGIRK
jgi:hypothetical protein